MLATLITNVGNGMHTIGISKLLYDETNNILAFGFVIILENIISFVVPFIAGAIVDRRDSKKISVLVDILRFGLLLSSVLVLNTEYSIQLLMIILSIINILNCFYKAANFKLISKLASSDKSLLNLSSYLNIIFQVGQMIGIGIAMPIIIKFGIKLILIINASSFLISSIIVYKMKFNKDLATESELISNISIKNIIFDWIDLIKLLKDKYSLVHSIIFSTVDLISISMINLMLVPLVSQYFSGKDYLISICDGAFAVGAIVGGYYVAKFIAEKNIYKYKFFGSLTQGGLFILITLGVKINSSLILVLLMFSLGLANTISIVIYQYIIQKESEINIKAKITSLKSFILSIISLIFIPFIGGILNKSLSRGIFISGTLFIIISVIIVLTNRRKELA
ncbi:MFS transporter [Clostridium paraputrificum]|uniref:MFS transporter n=1 Tax=Clostridium paraputrificum TaxID=29363 RepID=UPI003D355847